MVIAHTVTDTRYDSVALPHQQCAGIFQASPDEYDQHAFRAFRLGFFRYPARCKAQ